MSQRATTVRFVAGGAMAAIVAAAALSVSFAADLSTGCTFPDPAGDATVKDDAGKADGDVDIVSTSVAGDVEGLTGQVKVILLREVTTAIFFGDRHEIRFTAAGKAVILGASRYVKDPLANTYTTTPYASVGGTAVTPASYKVLYDVKTHTITYNVSYADLKTMLGAEPGGAALTGLASSAFAKTSPQAQTDVKSDDAAVAAGKAYIFGDAGGCVDAPAPAASATATATPSGSASPKPSSSATSSATPTPSGAAAPGTTMRFSGPTRVQFSDTFTTTLTLSNASGQPLSGKKVTGKHGTSPAASGTTNAAGQAKITIAARDKAGKRNLVVTFAGDAGNPARTLNRAITTVLESTRLGKAVSGAGRTRTVTVQLTDDDPTKKVLAGRNVTFTFSGRSVTVRTDSTGRAKVTAGTGAAMDITFSGESGAYAPVLLRTYAE